jgi:hypothetical protein
MIGASGTDIRPTEDFILKIGINYGRCLCPHKQSVSMKRRINYSFLLKQRRLCGHKQ